MAASIKDALRRGDFGDAAITRATAGIGAIMLGGAVVNCAAQVALARWMGAAEYGTYVNAIALASALAVAAGLGLPTANLRFVPQYIVEHRRATLRGLTRRSLQLVAIAGVVLAIGTRTLLPFTGYAGRNAERAFEIAAWMIPLFALIQLSGDSLRGRGSAVIASAIASLIRPGLILILMAGAVLIWGKISAASAVTITMIAMIIVFAVQFVLVMNHDASATARDVMFCDDRLWMRTAIPMLIAGLLMMALDLGDVLILGAMSGPRDVGIYSAAVRTSRIVNFALGATVAHAAPQFSSQYALNNQAGLQDALDTIAHIAFVPALLLAIPMLVWPGAVLAVFGDGFAAGRWVLIVLVAAQLVNVGAGPVYYLLEMTGHQDEALVAIGFADAMQLVLEIVFVRRWGVAGAAIATALSIVEVNVSMQLIVSRRLGLHSSIVSQVRKVLLVSSWKWGGNETA